MSSHSSSSADHLALRLDGRTVDATTTADVQAQVLRLFDRHAAGLRRYVRACGLPAEAAEDVVQEAFLALFHHLRRGGDSTNLPGWLVRVSYRTALKHRKRLARRQRHELAVDPPAGALADPSADPETHIATRQRRHRVQAVIRALPERERHCLWLRSEGVTYRDIAATLGISLGAVAKALARAALRLTNAVKE